MAWERKITLLTDCPHVIGRAAQHFHEGVSSMVELLRSSVHINAIAVSHGDGKGDARSYKVGEIMRPLSEAISWPSEFRPIHGVNDYAKNITIPP